MSKAKGENELDLSVEIVEFLDTETRDQWREFNEAVADMTLSSLHAWAIGAVIVETDDRLVLTAMGNGHGYASSIGIPKNAIIKRIVIRPAPTPKKLQ